MMPGLPPRSEVYQARMRLPGRRLRPTFAHPNDRGDAQHDEEQDCEDRKLDEHEHRYTIVMPDQDSEDGNVDSDCGTLRERDHAI